MPGLDYEFLWNMPLLVYLQPTKLSDAQALPISWLGGTRRGLQPGGQCTRRRSICYAYSRHPLQAQAPFNRSIMACHSLERTQVDPLCLSQNGECHFCSSWSPVSAEQQKDCSTFWVQVVNIRDDMIMWTLIQLTNWNHVCITLASTRKSTVITKQANQKCRQIRVSLFQRIKLIKLLNLLSNVTIWTQRFYCYCPSQNDMSKNTMNE